MLDQLSYIVNYSNVCIAQCMLVRDELTLSKIFIHARQTFSGFQLFVNAIRLRSSLVLESA